MLRLLAREALGLDLLRLDRIEEISDHIAFSANWRASRGHVSPQRATSMWNSNEFANLRKVAKRKRHRPFIAFAARKPKPYL